MSRYKSNINLKDRNNTLANIFNRVRPNSKVLDVGCASGYFDKVLNEKKKCDVVGIEIDPEDAKLAERYCRLVLIDDIEGQTWEGRLNGFKFDHIIFADVLEHLKKPEEVLERAKKYLAKNGTVLISIPNIAHISVRLELLLGNFIPESIGILDDTHLKYFTKDSFSSLVGSVGYDIKWASQANFDFPEEEIGYYLQKVGLEATKESLKILNSSDSIAYQYIFEIVPVNKNVKIDRINEKPIYVVREFLKSIEENYKSQIKSLRGEIKNLRRETNRYNSSTAYKVERKLQELYRKWFKNV